MNIYYLHVLLYRDIFCRGVIKMHDIERLLTGLSGSMKRTFEFIGDETMGQDWRTSELVNQTVNGCYIDHIPKAYGHDSNIVYSQSETVDGLDNFQTELKSVFNELAKGDSVELTVKRSDGTLKLIMVDNPIDDFKRSQRTFTKNPTMIENIVNVFDSYLDHIGYSVLTDLEKETLDNLVDHAIVQRFKGEVCPDEF